MEELLQKLKEKYKQHLETAELFTLKKGNDSIARAYVIVLKESRMLLMY